MRSRGLTCSCSMTCASPSVRARDRLSVRWCRPSEAARPETGGAFTAGSVHGHLPNLPHLGAQASRSLRRRWAQFARQREYSAPNETGTQPLTNLGACANRAGKTEVFSVVGMTRFVVYRRFPSRYALDERIAQRFTRKRATLRRHAIRLSRRPSGNVTFLPAFGKSLFAETHEQRVERAD